VDETARKEPAAMAPRRELVAAPTIRAARAHAKAAETAENRLTRNAGSPQGKKRNNFAKAVQRG
jgi:hypothetical protein